ncbi:MAG: hypothetical protein IKX53_08390 [Bacteroidales bacterium]|nr:hypothetical protein [Bacteroidales bacterium]
MKKLKFFSKFLRTLGVKDAAVAGIVRLNPSAVRFWFHTDDTYLGYIDEVCRELGYSLSMLLFSPDGEEIRVSSRCDVRSLISTLDISREELARRLGLHVTSVQHMVHKQLGALMISRLHDIARVCGFSVSFQIMPAQQDISVRHEGNRFVATIHLRPIIIDSIDTKEENGQV